MAFPRLEAPLKNKGSPPFSELPRCHVFGGAKTSRNPPGITASEKLSALLSHLIYFFFGVAFCLPRGVNFHPPIFGTKLGGFFFSQTKCFFFTKCGENQILGFFVFSQFLTRGGKTTKKSSYPDFLLANNFTQRIFFWLQPVALLNSPRFGVENLDLKIPTRRKFNSEISPEKIGKAIVFQAP